MAIKEDQDKPQQPDSGKSLNRREWLLNFGGTVLLSGFTGVAPESEPLSTARAGTLPPGLYQPSIDHVTHALASDGPFFPGAAGAETEFVRPRSGPFVPDAFLPDEFREIRRLVQIIVGEGLPAVEGQPVSGAASGIYDEVAEWIDLVVSTAPRLRRAAHNLTPEQRALAVAYFATEEPVRELERFEPEAVCKQGLLWLNEESERRFAHGFLGAGVSEQVELVASISDARADRSVNHAGTRLFDFLKAESVRGFYTSRAGLKELDYTGNAFYGHSPGCGLRNPGDPAAKPE
jgi:gluconate 2-dehydrogenase subunit 3-like protein